MSLVEWVGALPIQKCTPTNQLRGPLEYHDEYQYSILLHVGQCCRDYRPMEHLDRYEADGIDEHFIEEVTAEEMMAARMAAERELEERDVLEGRGRRRIAALDGR